jgi:hypothetical protein
MNLDKLFENKNDAKHLISLFKSTFNQPVHQQQKKQLPSGKTPVANASSTFAQEAKQNKVDAKEKKETTTKNYRMSFKDDKGYYKVIVKTVDGITKYSYGYFDQKNIPEIILNTDSMTAVGKKRYTEFKNYVLLKNEQKKSKEKPKKKIEENVFEKYVNYKLMKHFSKYSKSINYPVLAKLSYDKNFNLTEKIIENLYNDKKIKYANLIYENIINGIENSDKLFFTLLNNFNKVNEKDAFIKELENFSLISEESIINVIKEAKKEALNIINEDDNWIEKENVIFSTIKITKNIKRNINIINKGINKTLEIIYNKL